MSGISRYLVCAHSSSVLGQLVHEWQSWEPSLLPNKRMSTKEKQPHAPSCLCLNSLSLSYSMQET